MDKQRQIIALIYMEQMCAVLAEAGFGRTEGEVMFSTLGRLLNLVREGKLDDNWKGCTITETIFKEELIRTGLKKEDKNDTRRTIN